MQHYARSDGYADGLPNDVFSGLFIQRFPYARFIRTSMVDDRNRPRETNHIINPFDGPP